MSKYPVNKSEPVDGLLSESRSISQHETIWFLLVETKAKESALQKLLQKQTQKPAAEEEQITKGIEEWWEQTRGERWSLLETPEQRISNSFAIFASFLEALTNPRDDGKVLVSSKGWLSSDSSPSGKRSF